MGLKNIAATNTPAALFLSSLVALIDRICIVGWRLHLSSGVDASIVGVLFVDQLWESLTDW